MNFDTSIIKIGWEMEKFSYQYYHSICVSAALYIRKMFY